MIPFRFAMMIPFVFAMIPFGFAMIPFVLAMIPFGFAMIPFMFAMMSFVFAIMFVVLSRGRARIRVPAKPFGLATPLHVWVIFFQTATFEFF